MSDTRLTLHNLLGLQSVDLSAERLSTLADGETYRELQAKLASQAGPVWKAVRHQLPEELPKLLDVDGAKLLVEAWNKSRELRKYADETKYPPDEVVLVALTKNKVDTSLKPYLQLVVNGEPAGQLHFAVDLSLTFEGAELTITGGRIKKIRPGTCTGSGALKCEGAVLHSIDKKLLTLPGEVDLGEGLAIPA